MVKCLGLTPGGPPTPRWNHLRKEKKKGKKEAHRRISNPCPCLNRDWAPNEHICDHVDSGLALQQTSGDKFRRQGLALSLSQHEGRAPHAPLSLSQIQVLSASLPASKQAQPMQELLMRPGQDILIRIGIRFVKNVFLSARLKRRKRAIPSAIQCAHRPWPMCWWCPLMPSCPW